MKKIIFLIIIATIIVYGLFYLLKLLLFNNNVSGLKTFIDPEQVYSFQYPSNLVQQTEFDVQKSFTGSRSKYGNDLVSFYVNGDKVKLEDGRYIRSLDIFREHSIKITCRDYLDNRVSKTKRLKNYC